MPSSSEKGKKSSTRDDDEGSVASSHRSRRESSRRSRSPRRELRRESSPEPRRVDEEGGILRRAHTSTTTRHSTTSRRSSALRRSGTAPSSRSLSPKRSNHMSSQYARTGHGMSSSQRGTSERRPYTDNLLDDETLSGSHEDNDLLFASPKPGQQGRSVSMNLGARSNSSMNLSARSVSSYSDRQSHNAKVNTTLLMDPAKRDSNLANLPFGNDDDYSERRQKLPDYLDLPRHSEDKDEGKPSHRDSETSFDISGTNFMFQDSNEMVELRLSSSNKNLAQTKKRESARESFMERLARWTGFGCTADMDSKSNLNGSASSWTKESSFADRNKVDQTVNLMNSRVDVHYQHEMARQEAKRILKEANKKNKPDLWNKLKACCCGWPALFFTLFLMIGCVFLLLFLLDIISFYDAEKATKAPATKTAAPELTTESLSSLEEVTAKEASAAAAAISPPTMSPSAPNVSSPVATTTKSPFRPTTTSPAVPHTVQKVATFSLGEDHATTKLSVASQERWYDLVGLITRNNISEHAEFYNPRSSAYKALEWIVDYSEYMEGISSDDVDSILESYVLAVCYFAFHPAAVASDTQNPNFSSDWIHHVDKSICHWPGVGCGHLHRVVTLNLTNSRLEGTLPVEMSALDHLIELDLSHNSLGGPLPSEWPAAWSKIKVVLLSHNQLEGDIPETWHLWLTNQDISIDVGQNEDLSDGIF